MLAGGLAALAGVFLASFPLRASPRASAARAAGVPRLRSSVASTPSAGALVGGLIIGVAASLTAGYQHDLLFLGRGLGGPPLTPVMIPVLLIRPSGLFGSREITRV